MENSNTEKLAEVFRTSLTKTLAPNALMQILYPQIKKLTILLVDQLAQANLHLEFTHDGDRDNNTWIILTKKEDDKQWFQRGLKYSQLSDKLINLMNVKDIYMTTNSFNSPFRRLENLLLINGTYIDLDYYNLPKYAHMTAEEFYSILENEVFSLGDIPAPTFVLTSGRGLFIEWAFVEAVPATSKSVALWTALQKHLYKTFKDYGADLLALDAVHVFRIVGTINSKAHKHVEMIRQNGERHSLRYFQENVLPPLDTRETKGQPAKQTQVKYLFNVYTLHWARFQDLITLQSLRSAQGVTCENYREFMCFLYRYWSCAFSGDPQKALDDTLNFNEGFCPTVTR